MNSVLIIKELITWRAAVDILLAMAVFFVANFLGLKGIEWICSNLSHVALIAIIVIFQPELRKIFERAASVTRQEIQPVDKPWPDVEVTIVLRSKK